MECGVLIRRTHGKLVAVGFAENHRACGFQTGDGGAVVGGNVFAENFPSCRGAPSPSRHHILDTDWNTAHRRQGLTLGGHAVDRIGLFESALFAEGEICADLAVLFLDACVVRLGERKRSGPALLYCGASRVNRVLSQFHGRLKVASKRRKSPDWRLAPTSQSPSAPGRKFHPHRARLPGPSPGTGISAVPPGYLRDSHRQIGHYPASIRPRHSGLILASSAGPSTYPVG